MSCLTLLHRSSELTTKTVHVIAPFLLRPERGGGHDEAKLSRGTDTKGGTKAVRGLGKRSFHWSRDQKGRPVKAESYGPAAAFWGMVWHAQVTRPSGTGKSLRVL
jgi:hypothetical protein